MNEVDITNFLSSIEPFKSLSKSEVEGLKQTAKEVLFGKGETLYLEGDEADRVWIGTFPLIHMGF